MPRRLAQTSASATACASAAGTPRAAKMPATMARRSSAASLTFAGRAAAVSVDTGSVGKAPPPDSLGNRARLLVGELLRGWPGLLGEQDVDHGALAAAYRRDRLLQRWGQL